MPTLTARPSILVASAVLALALPTPSHDTIASVTRAAPAIPAPKRTETVATDSVCDHPPSTAYRYHWPIKPFDQQHPVRGYFGDPRTVETESASFGVTSPLMRGQYHFHDGIDIVAPPGTPVYPVVSGFVDRRLYSDEVSVDTYDGRVFQYYHIGPQVHVGEHVVADRTVLGRILPIWDHVHLTEIDLFRVHNPLDPGHLEPYRDSHPPEVLALRFTDTHGRLVDPEAIRGRVLIAADARDTPALPVAGEWFDLPVTPALVRWEITAKNGRAVVPLRTVVDFRHTEPPDRDFWLVYAPGTYQNFPVFGTHYYQRRPGRYLFNLTPDGLDTRTLPNGTYRLTVIAADVCGNSGTLSETIRIVG